MEKNLYSTPNIHVILDYVDIIVTSTLGEESTDIEMPGIILPDVEFPD